MLGSEELFESHTCPDRGEREKEKRAFLALQTY
jgi:hypothetical protein